MLSLYGTGSRSAQLLVHVQGCSLSLRNIFPGCDILRPPRMGHVKRTLALVLGLAAVLLFAPVARADFHGGKSPYRDLAGPLGHASDIKPADGEHDHDDGDDHDGDDHDGDANDGSHHDEDGNDSSDDHEAADDHDDDQANDHDDGDQNETADDDGSTAGGNNPGSGTDDGTQPGTNPVTPPAGPSTQSVPSNPTVWLWLLLVVIAGAAVTTAYVLRRRRMRAR